MVLCMVPSAYSVCSESRLQWSHTINDGSVLPKISQLGLFFGHYLFIQQTCIIFKVFPKPLSVTGLHKGHDPCFKKLESN